MSYYIQPVANCNLEPSNDLRYVLIVHFRFITKGEFKHHNRTEHKDGHLCQKCNKTFNRKALLERHFDIHTGKKKFPCPICTYGSNNKANCKRHVFNCHPIRTLSSREANIVSNYFLTSIRNRRKRETARNVRVSSTPSQPQPAVSTFTLNTPVPMVVTHASSTSASASEEACTDSIGKPRISHSIESILSQPSQSQSISTSEAISESSNATSEMEWKSSRDLTQTWIKNELSQVNGSCSRPLTYNWSHTSAPPPPPIFLKYQHKHNSNHQYYPDNLSPAAAAQAPYGLIHPPSVSTAVAAHGPSCTITSNSLVSHLREGSNSYGDYNENLNDWGSDESLSFVSGDQDVLFNSCEQGQGNYYNSVVLGKLGSGINQDSRPVPDFSFVRMEQQKLVNQSAGKCLINHGSHQSYVHQKGATSCPLAEQSIEEKVVKSEPYENELIRVDFMNEGPPPPPVSLLNGVVVGLEKRVVGAESDLELLNVEMVVDRREELVEESNDYVPKKLRMSKKYTYSCTPVFSE
jgi:hypothetical protein